MKYALLIVCVLGVIHGLGTARLNAAPVDVAYEARVATSTGSFLGYTVPMDTVVTGSFLFQTAGIVDTNPSDLNRGRYPHLGTGGFSASFTALSGVTPVPILIGGSGSPTVAVEWFPTFNDTWRYSDGMPNYGTMSVNGLANADVDLGFSMTKDVLFGSDANANPWTQVSFPPGTSHTFSLSDPSGTILLQITSAAVVPEPGTIGVVAVAALAACAIRRRRGVAAVHAA